MNQTNENIPNIKELVAILIKKGYTEKIAREQIKELSEIIWLSALDRVVREQNLDLSTINSLSGSEKLQYIEKNIPEDKLSQAIEAESAEKIATFLKTVAS